MHYFKEDLIIAITHALLSNYSYVGKETELAQQVTKYADEIDKATKT